MSIVNAFKKFTGREAEQSARGRSLTDGWTVLSDNPAEHQQNIVDAPQLPAQGSPHQNDPTLVASRKRARSMNPYLWEVDVEFAGLGTAQQPNPTSLPAQVDWSTVVSMERIDIDLDNRWIMNSAYQFFEGGLEREMRDQVMRVSKAMPSGAFSTVLQRQYAGVVNSDQYLFAEFGQARIIELNGVFVTVGNDSWWELSGAVQFKDPSQRGVPPNSDLANKLWHRWIVDEGYEYINFDPNAITLTLVPFLTSVGTTPAKPQALDGSGHPLSPANIAAGGFFIHTFRVFGNAPFMQLPLLAAVAGG